MPDPTGKTVCITGASQGIGRYLAGHFAGKRARILAIARNGNGLLEMAEEVAAAGGECDHVVADLADRVSLEFAALQFIGRGHRVDILINNAADVTSKSFRDSTLDEIARQIETNVTGALLWTHLLLPIMASDATIVNISSLAGYKPNPAQTVYSVSKAAVNGISDALRAELAPRGLHVMNVALSSVAVSGNPGRGQFSAEQFALALDRALEKGQDELFLSPATKWLMRLYRFWPPLMRLR